MGGTIECVYRDGSRLTPWMLFVINRASAELHARFGCELVVTSGIRTHQEQINIFLDRYRVQWFGSGPYGDVRWWNGKRYVRVSGAGTVAPPSTSNHEIQGTKAAADLRDTGRDAGVSRGGNERANWLRANAPRLGLIPSGYSFGEPWHYDIPNIFSTPSGGTPAGTESENDDMTPEERKKLDEVHSMLLEVRGALGAAGGHNMPTPDTIGHKVNEMRDYLGAAGGKGTRTPDTIGYKITQLFKRTDA